MTGHSFAFGQFELLLDRRLLLRAGREVRLGGPAFSLLVALVERAGEVVSRDELTAAVWPRTVVEETNLRVHIAALRRALGDDFSVPRFIVNVPGRGYSFVAPVAARSEPSTTRHNAPLFPATRALPRPVGRVIGRTVSTEDLASNVVRQRLVTIVGPGGIGKTTLALEVASFVAEQFEDRVFFVDLTSVTEDWMVPGVLAAALGHSTTSADPTVELVAMLQNTNILVLLDNCEHVISAAATLAEALVEAPGVHVLATSRELLRANGEWVHRLGPLELPSVSEVPITAADALLYPAVELFVERASSRLGGYVLTDEEAPVVAEICRKTDGMALAIEFAAGRVDTMGLRDLANSLDDCLRVLTEGRRTALPRHQTLRATLDWSYRLLAESERVVLRRLSVFVGTFSLEAAAAVAVGDAISSAQAVDDVVRLVAKSLVAADTHGPVARYRLLETTRAYTLEKLNISGEASSCAKRHAEHIRDLLQRAGSEWQARPGDEWMADYAHLIGNLRASLEWAFGPDGDAATAVALAAASATLWIQMSQLGLPDDAEHVSRHVGAIAFGHPLGIPGARLSECRAWMEAAIATLDETEEVPPGREMVLQTMLGLSLMYTHGATRQARAVLTRARELAEKSQNFDYQLRILAGLTLFCLRFEDFQGAMALARRADAIAVDIGDPVAVATAHCLSSLSAFFLGEYAEAFGYAQRSYRNTTLAMQRALIMRSGMDYSILARCIEVQVLWTRGLPDQSERAAREVLAHAQAGGHPASLCQALAWCGCRIPLRLGHLMTAERSIVQLKDTAERNRVYTYYALGLGYEGQLSARRGDPATGTRLLRACLDELHKAEYEINYTPFLAVLADLLRQAGEISESLTVVDEVLRRIEHGHGYWCMPEALRIKGDALLLLDETETTAAEDFFRRSFECAHRQQALSLELRAVIRLAQSQRSSGHGDDAHGLLASVYGRFREGFDTVDLRTARQLLDELA